MGSPVLANGDASWCWEGVLLQEVSKGTGCWGAARVDGFTRRGLYVHSCAGKRHHVPRTCFFGKRGAEQSMGLRASPGAPGIPRCLSASPRRGGERGARAIPPHKEPGEEAGERDGNVAGWREGVKRTHTRTRGCGGLRPRGAEGGGHTQPIVSG